jgi:pyridoxamine 5'-phosphate oxidase
VAAWIAAAVAAEVPQPTAMGLATVSADGAPSLRTVLVKGVDDTGIVFFTNYRSRKGRDLEARPQVAATITWVQLHRQIRLEGRAERLPEQRSDDYFATRPRGAQVAAAASPQSEEIPDRAWLERRVAELEAQHSAEPVPRPAHWGGFLVVPHRIEFWQGRRSRLHDRISFTRQDAEWVAVRLAP